MTRKRRARLADRGLALLPWAAGVGVALSYLAVRSHYFCFDGVACAIAVELSDWRHLVHGNHLGYGVLGLAFFKLWQTLGYGGPALLTLQVLDSLLGGAAAGVFCAILLDAGVAPFPALLAAAGLAVSFAWWLWSLEPQVYMLGCLFAALAFREALGRARPVRTGVLQALAVLGHVGHLMLAPALAYLLAGRSWRDGRLGAEGKPALARWAAALGATVLAAYALAALLCVRPSSLDEARVWLLGSAALKLDKSFIWFGGWSLEGLRDWLRMSLRIFADPMEAPARFQAAGWILDGAALAAAGLGAWLGWGRAAKAALLWLAGYALLYTTWQPHTMVYRISDLLPAWLLIALALGAARGARRKRAGARRWGAALAACWIGAAGFYNWRLGIGPWTDPMRNAAYQNALWLPSVVPQNAWVAALNLDQVYVPYFGHRRPLNIRYYHDDRLALFKRLVGLEAAREPVFVTSETLSKWDWEGFFRAYGLKPAGASPDGTALYRVERAP